MGGVLMWSRLRAFFREQNELHERLLLLDRPWEQQFAHWSGTDEDAVLHGRLAPPPGRRRPRGVTSGGWCACPQHADVGAR